MVLPAPVGPDDGHGLPGLHDEVQVLDERRVRDVAERDVLEGDAARRGAAAGSRPGATGSGTSSASSSSSNTRSADATARLEDVGDRGRPG